MDYLTLSNNRFEEILIMSFELILKALPFQFHHVQSTADGLTSVVSESFLFHIIIEWPFQFSWTALSSRQHRFNYGANPSFNWTRFKLTCSVFVLKGASFLRKNKNSQSDLFPVLFFIFRPTSSAQETS